MADVADHIRELTELREQLTSPHSADTEMFGITLDTNQPALVDALTAGITSLLGDVTRRNARANPSTSPQGRTLPPDPQSSIVYVARCPVHGLHGQRSTCYVCGGEVEQVPMHELTPILADEVPLDPDEPMFPMPAIDDDLREGSRG